MPISTKLGTNSNTNTNKGPSNSQQGVIVVSENQCYVIVID